MADQATQPTSIGPVIDAHDLPEDALTLAALKAATDSDSDSEWDYGNGNRTLQILEMNLNLLKTTVDFSEDDAQFEGMDPVEARVRAMEIAHALTSGDGNMHDVDTSGAPSRLIFECITHLLEHEKREIKRVQEEKEKIRCMNKMLKKARKCLKDQVARHQAQPEQQQVDE